MLRGSRSITSERIRELITAFWTSQLINVAAILRLPDAIKNEPLRAEGVATQVKAQAPRVRRVMRALASVAVFGRTPPADFTWFRSRTKFSRSARLTT